nr:hypothetical protein [uncultured Intestinibacter sp.]
MLFDENFRNKEYLDYKTLGDLAMEIGEYDKAISHYKKQLKIMSEPDYDYDEVFDLDSIEGTYLEYELYEQIARAYECENDYNNAIKYVKLMIKDDENRDVNKGDSLIKLSKLYILDNNKEEGIKILDDLLKYELDLMKKEYKESKFKFFGSRYQKSLYIEVCYELAELLKEDNRNQSMHYINLALDIYNKHKKNDLGNEISSILKLQTKFYKEDIESSLKSSETQPDIISKQNIEKAKSICKNSLLESKIYMEDYEYEKSKQAILKGVEIYKKYKLDDYKLDFYLKYQLANAISNIDDDLGNYPILFEKYLEAFKILQRHDFFDEYSKNMILLELYSYNSDYDEAIKYKKQCDFYYIAEYNIKHSEKEKVDLQKEYYEAGNSYFDCQNYNMAIKCYEKSMQNLIFNMGIFGGEITDFEDEYIYYDPVDKSYFGYEFYVKLCEAMANVYKESGNLDKQLEHLQNAVKCLDQYYYASEFSYSIYTLYTNIFSDISEIYIEKEYYSTAINYEFILIGIYNSPNLENSINEKFEDIENIRKLFETREIKEFILSDSYKFNLENKWLNYVKDSFEKIVEIAKILEDDELIKISEQKIKLLKDLPFDLDI